MNRRISCLLTSTAFLFAQPALAQAQQAIADDQPPADDATDVVELGTITVSGSLSPVATEQSGASVEIVDGREARDTDTRLTDRLDRLPGVNSVSTGGLGGATTLQIRGLPARYVGVQINGIDVSDPSGTQNQFDFGGLTGDSLGRIEVLKGSQSALYGSEAVGGLVDISTWRPTADGFSGELRTEAGRYETYSGALNMGYRDARGEVALTYARTDTEGFSSRSSNGEKDGFEQDMLTFYGEYATSEVLSLGLTGFHMDSDAEFDPFIGTAGSLLTEQTGLRGFARLTTGRVDHELSVSHLDIDRRDTSPGAFTPRFTGERTELSYLGSADLGRYSRLNFGVEYTEERFTAAPVRGSKDNTALHGEWLITPADTIDVSLALRQDEDSDFGGETTGRAAAVWRPAEGWALRAVAGTGFRAPSLFERFSAFGDPTLEPEESRSYEIGVERSFASGSVEATLFKTEIDNLIRFDPTATKCGSGFGCFTQVPGKTTSEGLELAGDFDINAAVAIYGSYTYTDARNNGQRLTRTPRHDAVVGLEAQFTPAWRGGFDVRHVADVLPSAFAPVGNKVGDYTLVGARIEHDVTERAVVYLRVENLFDEDYETAGGFNTPGRSAHVGLSAKF